MESSSSLSGSSKRAKAPGSVGQVAHCLVDGCNADLSRCREYHRRHKVCEVHSKTPKVTIGGREQRFCQQCSRFHSLAEFDEVKRSCRKRLDGHNRRRRKPQPDSLSKSSGMLFSGQQGAKLVSFSSSQMFPTSTVSSTWAGFSKAENDHVVLYSNQSQPQPHLNYIDTQNQFKFMQGSSEASSISHQPLVDQGNSSSSQKFFAAGLMSQIVDSDRALSLLSSASSVNREIGLSHVVQPGAIPHPHSLVHYGGLTNYPFNAHEIETKPGADCHAKNTAHLQFHNVMQNAPTTDVSSTGGPHHTHTFMWDQD
ncbi:PREDICTED: squamosa promoter-binding-like protein 13A isoform X2 [Ipomoea nil]|uniref:squamosa promoter-binding-like protein 13A isoform X2 n=1 Tax=Ipomoea nil TaxID=35883 RepID=UPI000901C5D2|nr:PREDICTED: squamosa promoter-binding-like protein 13A isoform X2 [Ipomoea nil]